MIEATKQPADRLCTACFTGNYPIALPEDGRLGKGVLELELPIEASGRSGGPRASATRSGTPRCVDVPLMDLPLDVEGVSTSAGGGAAEAVLRP